MPLIVTQADSINDVIPINYTISNLGQTLIHNLVIPYHVGMNVCNGLCIENNSIANTTIESLAPGNAIYFEITYIRNNDSAYLIPPLLIQCDDLRFCCIYQNNFTGSWHTGNHHQQRN